MKFVTKEEFHIGNSQLLIGYREALIKAFELGEDIKKVYGIVPPKALHDPYIISLAVS